MKEETSHLVEIKRIVKENYQKLSANKSDNLNEMDEFLGTHKLLKLTPSKRNGKSE